MMANDIKYARQTDLYGGHPMPKTPNSVPNALLINPYSAGVKHTTHD